jgi:hypothetical protein
MCGSNGMGKKENKYFLHTLHDTKRAKCIQESVSHDAGKGNYH